MPRFRDIPQFTGALATRSTWGWTTSPSTTLATSRSMGSRVSGLPEGLRLDREAETRFMEYMLKGGRSGLDIYLNRPDLAGPWREDGRVRPRGRQAAS